MCGRTCVPSHSLIASFFLQQSPSVPHHEGQAPGTGGLQPIAEEQVPWPRSLVSQIQGALVVSGHVCINFRAEIQNSIELCMNEEK